MKNLFLKDLPKKGVENAGRKKFLKSVIAIISLIFIK